MADKKISELTAYTPAIDADQIAIVDSTAGATKRITWANIKATLKTYFDTLYLTATSTSTLTNKTLTTPIIASLYQDAGKTKLMTVPDTASDTLSAIAATQTLTNKRITKRVGTAESSATPTINTDNYDMYILTAQAAGITSFTTNLSGTPTNGQTLWIAITGTAARGITWGDKFEASTTALPTTTVTTARLDVGFVWNAVTEKWRCLAVA